MYLGHALTTYSLQPYFDNTVEAPVEGGWKHIIKEALDSTRVTFPVR